jgi:hypothetical protein
LFIFEDAKKKDKAKGKARGAKFNFFFLIIVSFSAFSCLIYIDSSQFMILDPVFG